MAQTSDSLGPLLAAFLGNMSIAILKVTAAFFTGSSAMMAESVHSFADSGNQVLLYIGIKRAKRKPDALHPFGYGKEAYFWAFLVSIGIFAGGSVFSIYHGIHNLTAEAPEPGNPIWAYGVLSGSIIFEGFAFMVAWKAFKKKHAGTGFLKSISEARDPVLFTVLLEDGGAMLGLIIALVGVFLAHQTGNHVYDAGASILIGTLLAGIAYMLAREVHSLLLGESGHPQLVADINEILEKAPEIEKVSDLRTLQMGADALFVMIEALVNAKDHEGDVAAASDAVEARIHALNPHIRRVYLEAQSAKGLEVEAESE